MTRRSLLAALPLLTGPTLRANWPQWRGPDRNGISPATGLLRKWPAGGPRKAWEASGLGEGYASFSASNGNLFTQGQRSGKQYLIALDQQTGAKAWETENGPAYDDSRGSGPRGTPTVDGGRIYTLSGAGHLLCVDAATGAVFWRVDLLRRFGGSNIRWGISESPLIDGEKIIVSPGGAGAGVVALNKADGELIWKSESDEPGYSSAVTAVIGGVKQYILLTGEAGVGLRASDGRLLWRYARVSNRTANVATPIVSGDKVFLSSDYGTGCALLQLEPTAGGVKAVEIYFSREMRNHYSSSVLLDGYLYGFSSRILTAMKFDTGAVAWQDRSVGKGQVISAEGLLYLLSEDGVVGLAEADPAAYREISRFEIGRGDFPTWTLPVIADGKLILRDQDKAFSYEIAA